MSVAFLAHIEYVHNTEVGKDRVWSVITTRSLHRYHKIESTSRIFLGKSTEQSPYREAISSSATQSSN